MMLQRMQIPATPVLLLVTAPKIPATWVPWPKSSLPVEPFIMEVILTILAARSGCVLSTPVSTTAILILGSPWVLSQAAGALMAWGAHWAMLPYLVEGNCAE